MATITSSASTTDDATVNPTQFWLKDPLDPSLNIALELNGAPRSSSTEDQGVFSPLGREDYVVVTDVIRGERGELTMMFYSSASYDAFTLLRSNQRVLLVQYLDGEQHYVKLGAERVAELRDTAEMATKPWRTITIPWAETEEPE